MNIKNTFSNLIVLSIGLIFGLSIGEIAIRYILPQKLVKSCYKFDPEVTLVGTPSCRFIDDWEEEIPPYEVCFNNLGYRMDKDVLPNDKNLVACIGDSFTYGWGVEMKNAFLGLFNAELQNQSADVKLINTGFPSYSTGHCSKILERLDDEIPVQKAIYFMFFNDIFDNVRSDKNYVAYSYNFSKTGAVQLEDAVKKWGKKRSPFYKKILRWLYKHSHLAIFVRKSMPDFKDGESHTGPRPEDGLNDAQIDTMTMVTLAHIDHLNQVCKERDIELQIVWIPCWQELNLGNDYDWTNHFPFKNIKEKMAAKYLFFDPTSKINELLGENGKNISDYYFSDGHYNNKGNQLFYQSIKKEVFNFVVQ